MLGFEGFHVKNDFIVHEMEWFNWQLALAMALSVTELLAIIIDSVSVIDFKSDTYIDYPYNPWIVRGLPYKPAHITYPPHASDELHSDLLDVYQKPRSPTETWWTTK